LKLSPILQQVSVPISSPIPQPLPEPSPATPPTLTVISNEEVVTLSTESSALSTLNWYLVHTKPRQEEIALANLERQGYECYLPQMRIERVRRRKAEVTTEPMFPRYLFIRLDSSDQGKSWSPIRSTLGVSQLVHFGIAWPVSPQPRSVDAVSDDLQLCVLLALNFLGLAFDRELQ
jgi:hypothetical protein